MEKVALVFPGQGAEYIGMGRLLFDSYKVARQAFEEANDVLGFDLKKLCFGGSRQELSKTVNMQLAILVCSIATFRVYMHEIGIVPVVTAGHSLGEYSALVSSGCMNFKDALKIVRERGRFLQEAIDKKIGHMSLVSGVNSEIVNEQCKKNSYDGMIVDISCFNSQSQTTISGHTDAMLKVEDILIDLGASITPLIDSAPYHSVLMKPASEKLELELRKYSYNTFNWPVISNVSVMPYRSPDQVVENLVKQIASPVQWTKTVQYMKSIDVDVVIEIGTKALLTNLVKEFSEEIFTISFGQKSDRQSIINLSKSERQLREQEVLNLDCKTNIDANSTVISKCLDELIRIKNSNYNNHEYDEDLVCLSYNKILKLQEQLKVEGLNPSLEQMMEAIDILKAVLVTNITSADEQSKILEGIFEETGTQELFNGLIF